jgi:hypothetical protein
MLRLSYPCRQQYRHVGRSAACGIAGLATGILAVIVATAGALQVAGVLVLTSGRVIDARRWVRLARRSRIGARSEAEVRRSLTPLGAEGWRLRHSLPYKGRGDIDSVAIAPTGIAFAIETRTRTFDTHHLAGVRDMAAWLYHRRRRWCRRGALPVLCVVPARGVERGPGRGPGRLSRPPRAVPPSGSPNRTAPSVPGRGHGYQDVIVTELVSIAAASACCWANPSVLDPAASPVMA